MSAVSTRKAEILDLARVLFAEKGYAGTSMRDLADASGLLPGSLYAHFRSKADIVRALMQHFFDQQLPAQREAFDLDGTGAERLAAMIKAVFDVCARNSEEIRLIHDEWKVLVTLEGLEDVMGRAQESLDMWVEVVGEGVADGTIRPSVDPELMMRVVIHAIVGMIDLPRYVGRPEPSDVLRPEEFLELIFTAGAATAIPDEVAELAVRQPSANGSRGRKTSSKKAAGKASSKKPAAKRSAAKKAPTGGTTAGGKRSSGTGSAKKTTAKRSSSRSR